MAIKKTSLLTNDLIAIKGQAKKTVLEDKEITKPLNFKVPAKFRKEFRTIALEEDLKLNELLYKCFETYKKSSINNVKTKGS